MDPVGYTKLVRYCLYRERCISEVRLKLKGTELPEREHGKIIRKLEEDGYLDERRFAASFARDKFRLKKWGKKKIRAELSSRKIPDEIIEFALKEIDEEDYSDTLKRMIEKKSSELTREANAAIRKQKLIRYLLSKGFEYDVIREAVG